MLWFVVACSWGPKGTETAVCSDLDEARCQATSRCLAKRAFPASCEAGTVQWGESVYAGCFTVEDGDTAACEDLGGICWRPTQPDALYEHPDLCIPEGWECAIGEDACTFQARGA